jgi:Ser/Thr protein kinase RdoA (MazF antagonist)
MSSAVQAAIEAAEQFGIFTTDPLLLQETNNTVLWLRPEPVVAKVAVRDHSKAEIRLEHAVAVELAALGAEIARPLPGTSPVLHPASGFVVTLWERLRGTDRTSVAPRELAGSLQRLHSALTQTEVELPSFRAMLIKSHRVLEDDSFRATSAPADLELLRSTYDRGFAALEDTSLDRHRLHGEPHDGNRIKTITGLRWIDFESCCVGPLEWDLAFQPASVVQLFAETDSNLLALLRSLNSARFATWCLLSHHPEMRHHGEIHLALLRQTSGDPRSSPGFP